MFHEAQGRNDWRRRACRTGRLMALRGRLFGRRNLRNCCIMTCQTAVVDGRRARIRAAVIMAVAI